MWKQVMIVNSDPPNNPFHHLCATRLMKKCCKTSVKHLFWDKISSEVCAARLAEWATTVCVWAALGAAGTSELGVWSLHQNTFSSVDLVL